MQTMIEAGHLSANSSCVIAWTGIQGEDTLFWLMVLLVSLVAMFGSFCSYLLVHHLYRRHRHQKNEPLFYFHPLKFPQHLSFPGDYLCRWLVIKSEHPAEVQTALRLTKTIPCSWDEGLVRMYDRKLFISAPLNGWIIVVGQGLPDPTEDVDACYRFLTNLSLKAGVVQFFSVNRSLHHHAWAVLDKGAVQRAYAWGGQTLWNQGTMTSAEKTLGLSCLDYGEALEARQDRKFDPMAANTDKVPLLAARWSLDPAALCRNPLSERPGLIGELPMQHNA